MLKSESLKSKLKFRTGRTSLSFFCILAAFLIVLPLATGQDFTLQMAPFPSPSAIIPGGATEANITLGAINGYTGTVDLTCTVTSQPVAPEPPVCEVSPPSVKPSGGASVTVTGDSASGDAATPMLYIITVTGTTSGTTQSHSQSQNLTVLSVSPQFTITVGTAVAPSSVPAGSGGQGVININPINGYSSGTGGGVTLSCSSITPLVTVPPVCSFNPQPVPVNGALATSTITITTVGPVKKGAMVRNRTYAALWLPVPMLALVGLGAAVGGKRSRKAWGLLALFVVSGAMLLMPACGNSSSSTSTSTPNGVTPNNTYTFTVTGVDSDGNISSNTGSATTANPSVSLTVTTATN
ncbi:MAG TPA: hypothetical protein VFE61_28280 [Candidatus Sulfotelmatobacter sp.]|jgi:hypothetical protein|nr:hypothetical protein [Candidatus Sulfotelmatobacter sp.]